MGLNIAHLIRQSIKWTLFSHVFYCKKSGCVFQVGCGVPVYLQVLQKLWYSCHCPQAHMANVGSANLRHGRSKTQCMPLSDLNYWQSYPPAPIVQLTLPAKTLLCRPVTAMKQPSMDDGAVLWWAQIQVALCEYRWPCSDQPQPSPTSKCDSEESAKQEPVFLLMLVPSLDFLISAGMLGPINHWGQLLAEQCRKWKRRSNIFHLPGMGGLNRVFFLAKAQVQGRNLGAAPGRQVLSQYSLLTAGAPQLGKVTPTAPRPGVNLRKDQQ